jgi:hypothetical protein
MLTPESKEDLLKQLESIENLAAKVLQTVSGTEPNGLYVIEKTRWILGHALKAQAYVRGGK